MKKVTFKIKQKLDMNTGIVTWVYHSPARFTYEAESLADTMLLTIESMRFYHDGEFRFKLKHYVGNTLRTYEGKHRKDV